MKTQLSKEKKIVTKKKNNISDLEKEIDLYKPTLKVTKDIWIATKEKAVAAKGCCYPGNHRFRKSLAFAEEVTEGSTKVYQLGFTYYKAQVA